MDQTPPEPANLRLLRVLVTVLMAVMIAGIVTIVALLALRLNMAPAPALPEQVTLPEGATARAVTFGQGWVAVVTTDDRILVLDAETGALRQSVPIEPGP